MAAGDVAQDHEEGVARQLLGLGREALDPPCFVRPRLLDQLIEEDSQFGTWNLMLAERENWAIHAHLRSLSTRAFSYVNQALDPEVAHIDPILLPILCILPKTLGVFQLLR